MPAVKTKRISTLIESQLPEFITTEYELFTKFVQKYYLLQLFCLVYMFNFMVILVQEVDFRLE